MKNSALILLVSIFLINVSCSGRLSDDQIAAYQNEMEERKILRITETEIAEAAQILIDSLKSMPFEVINTENSLYEAGEAGSIKDLNDEKSIQIFEAYEESFKNNIEPIENFQKLTNGNYYYTIPIIETDSAGNKNFNKMRYLELNRTEIVKFISKNKED